MFYYLDQKIILDPKRSIDGKLDVNICIRFHWSESPTEPKETLCPCSETNVDHIFTHNNYTKSSHVGGEV